MSKKTEEIRKRIEMAEKRKGQELTKEQKRNIEKSVLRKYRRKNFFRAFLVTIGLAAGAGGVKLLDSAQHKGIDVNKNAIEIDASETDKDIEIENLESDREVFLNDLKVTFDDAQKLEMQKLEGQALRDEIVEKIDSLTAMSETPEEGFEKVINYLKQYYVDAYNQGHEEKIDINNIDLSKTRSGAATQTMYRSEDGNGKTIIKSTTKPMGYNDLDQHEMIKVVMNNQEGTKIEKATEYEGEYVKVYDDDEFVEKYEDDTILTNVAGVLDNGIDYAYAVKENDKTKINETKNDLVDALLANHEKEQDKGYEIGE